jgi:CO/xanthine dehydrogenase FAD-binding subunit
MNRFDYVRPASVADAIAASMPNSAYFAADTNLLDLMKGGVSRPDRLVDVSKLPGLERIERLSDGTLRGALVRNAILHTIRNSPGAVSLSAEALLSGASAQLRNAATVGGNLLQRTRCAYFYDVASVCNRRQAGAGCGARHGESRSHAILGWSESCIATHPSDFCVPLVALDAVVEIDGPNRLRGVAVEELHPLPGDTPEQENALKRGEPNIAVHLFGIAPENILIRSRFLGGGFRIERADQGTTGAGHPCGPAGRPAGETRATARPDVRSSRPSFAHAPDHPPRHRSQWPADRASASREGRNQQFRRFL